MRAAFVSGREVHGRVPVRDNIFALRAKQRAGERAKNTKAVVLRDAQPTVEEQLVRLEDDIRRLKVEFDIYFNGAAKRPPYDTKGRVETLIKRLADDRTLSYAQRYHYNSLTARYTSFMQLWRRTMQEREEGRGHGSAARRQAQAQEPEAPAPTTFVCKDARADVATVRGIYEALVDARRRCGEEADDLSFARFHRMVAEKSEALKARAGCERVHFSVAVEGGRVSFKVKADK